MRRREFLQGAGGAAAGLLLGCSRDNSLLGNEIDGGLVDAQGNPLDGGTRAEDLAQVEVIPPEETLESMAFTLGVASGDVTTSRAMLWTRYLGSSKLQLVVWQMNNSAYAREVARVDVMATDGGFVHWDVSGLQPGERYRYAFFEMNGETRTARSPVGRFRAAISDDALEPLVLGACSCTSASRAFTPLERAGERPDLDLFLLLGDTAYCDGATDTADYRGKWQGTLDTPGYRAVRAASSLLATWDDHEVTNDWNPENLDAARFAAANNAFFDHQPLRRDAMNPTRIWKSLRWGRTLEIFVLDSRSERKPSTRSTAQAEYLSKSQMDWLKAGLVASTAKFKLILNSVPITMFPWSQLAGTDAWAGYAAQRTEILAHVEMNSIKGVVWLSGDHHFASLGRVSGSGVGASAIEILAGPGAQTANPAFAALSGAQWDWASGTNNYTSLQFDPAAGSLRVMFHDKDGATLADRSYTP